MFRSHRPSFATLAPDAVGAPIGACLNRALAQSTADLISVCPSPKREPPAPPVPGEAAVRSLDVLLAFRHDLLAIGGFDERITDLPTLIADAAGRLTEDGVRVRGALPAANRTPHSAPITSSIVAPPRSCIGAKRTLVDAEHMEVRRFLSRCTPGRFLEIGANDPVLLSQTWHLAQSGWRGLLVEPIPELATRLRAERPDAQVVEAVCTRPASATELMLRVPQSTGHATVMDRFADDNDELVRAIRVSTTTADALIERELAGKVDFISIDVEGHEADVLKGLSLQRWRPTLVLIEDDMSSMTPSRLLWGKGYRLLRRTQNNNWWIPADAKDRMTVHERVRMLGKFLRMPFRG